MRLLFFRLTLLLAFALPNQAHAQIITTDIITGSYCAGASIPVGFFASAGFAADNVFRLELSSATGSFTAPTIIGVLPGNSSGVITANIPSGQAPGSGYRLRVVGNSPTVTGNDNGANLTIRLLPTVNTSSSLLGCSGQPFPQVQFTSNLPGTSFSWTNSNPSIGLSSSGTGNTNGFIPDNTGTTVVSATVTVTPANNGCTGRPQNFVISIPPRAQLNPVAERIGCNGTMVAGQPLSASAPGSVISWTNPIPGMGLAASGSGSIPPFIGINTTPYPIAAPISISSRVPYLNFRVFSTHGGGGAVNEYGTNPNTSAELDNLFNTANANTYSLGGGAGQPALLFNWTSANTLSSVLGVGIPSDYFGIEISGTFIPQESGIYTFRIDGDDAVDISLDNAVVASRYGVHGFGTPSEGSIALVAGQTYILKVRQQDYAGGEGLSLSWKRPSQGSFSIHADEIGGCASTTEVMYRVDPTPVINSLPSFTLCAGAPFFFNATTNSPATLSWDNSRPDIGLAPNGSGSSILFTPVNNTASDISANIHFTATGTSVAGCVANAVMSLTIQAVPATPAVPSHVVCANGQTNFVHLPDELPGTIYSWTNSDPTIGLAASGTGIIPPFTALNATASPRVATITATPSRPVLTVTGYKTHGGTGLTNQYPANPSTLTELDELFDTDNSNTVITGTAQMPASSLLNWSSAGMLQAQGLSIGSDYFAVEIRGTFIPKESGVYSFVIDGDDAVDLTLNNSVVISRYGSHGFGMPQTGQVTLTAGLSYNLRLRQQDFGGGEGLSLAWKRPSQSVPSIQPDEIAACTGTPVTFIIQVNPVPVISTAASIAFCPGVSSTVTLASQIPSASYTWTTDNTATGLTAGGSGNPTFIPAATAAGVNAILFARASTVFSGVTCIGVKTIALVVNPQASVQSVANQVVCPGSSTSASFTKSPSDALLNWTNTNTGTGLAASGTGNIAAFIASNSGSTILTSTVTVTPQHTANGLTCTGAPVNFTIEVNPKPVITLSSSTLSTCHASVATLNLTTNTGAGTSLSWTNTNSTIGIAASGTASIGNFTAVNTGSSPVSANVSVAATFTNGGATCTADAKEAVVVVGPKPVVSIPANISYCAGEQSTGLTFSSSLPASSTFSWTNSVSGNGLAASVSNGGSTLPAFTTVNTGTGVTHANILVTATAFGCNSDSKSFLLSVQPRPGIGALNSMTTCPGTETAARSAIATLTSTSTRWTNSDPSIGLAASGIGPVPAYTSSNDDIANKVATITVTPVLKTANFTSYRTHGGSGNTVQYPASPNSLSTMDALFNIANSNTTAYRSAIAPVQNILQWNDNGQGATAGLLFAGPDYSAVMINSIFTPLETGIYTFRIDGDDAVDLFIDGSPVVSYYGTHGLGNAVTGTVALQAGTVYQIRVRQQDYSGGEGLLVDWKRPSQNTYSFQPDEIGEGCDGPAQSYTMTVIPKPQVTSLADRTLCNGVPASALTFSSPISNSTYSWRNTLPSIGVAATGTGNLPAFTAVNNGAVAVTDSLFITPSNNYNSGNIAVDLAFTGSSQTWTVPQGVTSVLLEAWGAKGASTDAAGGNGAYARGTLAVTPGQVLSIGVGGAGNGTTGGFNGGGNGGTGNGGGGGGATDVRVNSGARVLVAGGGGGAGGTSGSPYFFPGGKGGTAAGGSGAGGSGGGGGAGASPNFGGNGGGSSSCSRGGTGGPGSSSGAGGLGGNRNANNAGSGGGGGGGYVGAAGGGAGGSNGCLFGSTLNGYGGGGGGAAGSSFTGGVTNVSTINDANAGNGKFRLTYNAALTCAGRKDTVLMIVHPTPTATIRYEGSPYCSSTGGTGTVTKTGNAIGTYSSGSGLVIDAGSGAIDIAASTPGTYTILYTVPAQGSCGSIVVSTTATITETPAATISYSGGPYCNTSGTVPVLRSGTAGGTYSATPAGLSIDAATGAIDLGTSQQGAYTVTYSFTASGCGIFTSSTSVQVFSAIATSIAYPGAPYCATSGSIPVFFSGYAGGVYSAAPAGLSIDPQTGAIDLATSASGIYTVTYSANNGACSIIATAPITVKPAALITVLDNRTFCGGTTTTPIDFQAPAGTSFSWVNDNTAIGLQASGSGSIPAFAAINNSPVNVYANISVYPTGGTDCSLKPYVLRITVKPLPFVNPIAGQVLCAGSNSSAIAFSGNATTAFTWTNNNASIGLGAAGTGGIAAFNAVNNTGVLQTATVTVIPVAAGCTGAPESFTIGVSPSAGSISYPQATYCQYAWAYVRRTGSSGGTYSATPAGLALNAVDGSINLGASPPATYTITYSVGALAGCGATATTQLTVQPQASVNTISNQLYCSGMITAPIPFTGTASNFSWTNDNPSIGLAAAGSGLGLPSFRATNAGPGQQFAYIRVTPLGNGSSNCPGKPMTFRITVNYCPPVTTSSPAGGDAATMRTALSRDFVVGPNPATSTVVLQYSGKDGGPFTVRVVAQSGEALTKPYTFAGSTCTLSLDGIVPGSYLLEVTQVRTGITFKRQLIKL